MTAYDSQRSDNMVFAQVGREEVVEWKPLFVATQTAERAGRLAINLIEDDDAGTIRQRLNITEVCATDDYLARNIGALVEQEAEQARIYEVGFDREKFEGYLTGAQEWFHEACMDGANVHVVPISSDMTTIIGYHYER